MESDGFTLVKNKRNTRRKNKIVAELQSSEVVSDENINEEIMRVERNLKELITSPFMKSFDVVFSQVMKHLSSQIDNPILSIESIVCYGLGSLTKNRNSSFQFCLLRHISEKLNNPKIYIYDPVFSKLDNAVLQKYNCELININEKCARKCNGPTLFYMPYCFKELYDNLLSANWNLNDLSSIVILGISLKNISDDVGVKFPFIHKAVNFATAFPIQDNFRIKHMFDLQFNVFEHQKLKDLNNTFWLPDMQKKE